MTLKLVSILRATIQPYYPTETVPWQQSEGLYFGHPDSVLDTK